MKWFSIRGIFAEIRRIRWPKSKETLKSGLIVIIFVAIFSLIFVGFDFIAHAIKSFLVG